MRNPQVLMGHTLIENS
ncbi:hypothetical protein Nmel_001702 [Mimus melanotis]